MICTESHSLGIIPNISSLPLFYCFGHLIALPSTALVLSAPAPFACISPFSSLSFIFRSCLLELQIQREKLMEQREALHRELMQEAERLKRLRHEVKQVDDSLLNSEQVSHK
ncbi:hypothetical protein O6H91_08G003200 [Diphasiastrum complanatum]|uniref:Uncharacterized protein n=1 Tax=Diphasiastrum complanatum TaxID=34168 RepID=A0ACC2CUH6_DIPCM|nr:hypothetical protein O6H91_08G003200 [Diphasiastrum complanatum]